MKQKGLLLCLLVTFFCVSFHSSLMGQAIIDGFTGIKQARFGPQYGHPFSLQNVFEAFDHMDTKSRGGVTKDMLRPTHKYVRFMPASESELYNLKQLEGLNLFPYPLDCEITEGFVGIDNPFLVNGFPQYWSIVRYDYPLNTINCAFAVESELLLFDEEINGEKEVYSVSFINNMIKELVSSIYIDGNFDLSGDRNAYPWGYVRYMDTVFGQKGVEGIIVEAFNFWQSRSKITNSQGYFEMHEYNFILPYSFRVKFSRSDFALRNEDNTTDLEYVTGTQQSYRVVFSGNEAKYCPVFQAAELLYYGQTDVPSPPLNDLWSACLRIHVFPNISDPYHSSVGFFEKTESFLGDRPELTVYGLHVNGADMSSDELYGTAIHELGHAIHYGLDTELFSSIQQRVKESIANGIEYHFTLLRYPLYNFFSYSVDMYTDIVRDLCDGVKLACCNWRYDYSSGNTNAYYDEYNDEIGSTYTITSVIEAVRTCTSPQAWKSRLYYHTSPHATGEDLMSAFTFWFDLSH